MSQSLKQQKITLQSILSMQSPQSPKQPQPNPQIFFKTTTQNELEIRKTFQETLPYNHDNHHNGIGSGTYGDHGSQLSRKSVDSNRVYSKIEERMLSKYTHHVNYATMTHRKFTPDSGDIVTYQQYPHNTQPDQHNPNKLLQFPRSQIPQTSPKISPKTSQTSPQPQQQIPIQKTLQKPKFAFKQPNHSIDDTYNTQDDLISFDSSSIQAINRKKGTVEGEGIGSGEVSLNVSKSASDFGQVLRIQEDRVNLRVVRNGDLEGYLLSKIDKKEENIAKRLQQIKKGNQAYDTKIKQKQRQIQLIKKHTQKQQKQLQKYQQKLLSAYDNVTQPECLLLSSRNYEVSNTKMQARVTKKTVIGCQFEGLSRKLCKQILYGKCMILETDLVQVGFDNTGKMGLMELFFTVKEDLGDLEVFLENFGDNGYKIEGVTDDGVFRMRAQHVPAGKKIKLKVNVSYLGTLRDRIGFMNLKIVMKINQNSVFTQTTVLPFSLYRNFITELPAQTPKKPLLHSLSQLSAPSPSAPVAHNYPYVTQWQNCCDEFIKNPKGYLDSIFKSGQWIDQNIYHVDLLFRGMNMKAINVVLNCRNFAIQMQDTMSMEVVMVVGGFLARVRDKEGSKVN